MASRPVKIKYDVSNTVLGVQEMTDAEINYTSYILASELINNTYLSLTVNGATGTSIGEFADTIRPYAVGDHPVGTNVISTVYSFKQNRTDPAIGTPIRPLKINYQGPNANGLMELNNDEIGGEFLSKSVSAYLAAYNTGSYVLKPTAPTSGGTWANIATITNSLSGGSFTTILWRCISPSTVPSVTLPLKTVSGGMRELSDVDIASMFPMWADYVNSTGIGTYSVGESAPAGGTWIKMGDTFSDTRRTVENLSYTGAYTGAYTGNYTGYYSSSYTGSYAGARDHAYTRNTTLYYVRYFSGSVNGSYPRYYTGYYTGSYVSSYIGSYAGARANTYTGTYTGYYTGLVVTASTETISNVSLWFKIGI